MIERPAAQQQVHSVRPHVIGCAWILACAAAAAGEVNVPGPAGSSPMATRSAPAAMKAGTVSAPAEPIDINSASRAQLKQLSGIGDAEVPPKPETPRKP